MALRRDASTSCALRRTPIAGFSTTHSVRSPVSAEGLKGLKIPYYKPDQPYGKYKDANDALLKDNTTFNEIIEELENAGRNIVGEELEETRKEFDKMRTSHCLDSFVERIEKSKAFTYISTGFDSLDKSLDGGLFKGLYIVGAISALGKTTLVLQIADQIAQTKQDVLIFSLEMDKDELIAKSTSRHTFLECEEQNLSINNAKTTRGILTGSRYGNYQKTEVQTINRAIETYRSYAAHIIISEGVGNVGVEQVRSTIEQYKNSYGAVPVVIIDYLQILAPYEPRSTDKQNTDRAVLELKRISRDYDIPIIVISSFNRDNYTAPVNLSSFKESGAIEYSSDVLIGLQYGGMDYDPGESSKARDTRIRDIIERVKENSKKGDPIEIQVKILKNRHGRQDVVSLYFYPMFNYFSEEGI